MGNVPAGSGGTLTGEAAGAGEAAFCDIEAASPLGEALCFCIGAADSSSFGLSHSGTRGLVGGAFCGLPMPRMWSEGSLLRV